ncbi:hypothetical protein PIB30_011898 [Stylosanthes scabra]|uniref:Uncharacterized protein n=1 Tax=Stylosanthes scabra TaxID=79078 RepID=A0ABU6V522_9FABA|nr:hypothetical protein [Stylosanthes scabra]
MAATTTLSGDRSGGISHQCHVFSLYLSSIPCLSLFSISPLHENGDGGEVQSVLECLRHIQSPCFQRLRIERCWSTISISGDYFPAELEYLEIWKCSKLTFPEPVEHKLLTEIHVSKCDSVRLFPLGALPNLKKFTISDCSEMDCFGEECLPPSLTSLEISNCQKLESWITSNGLQSEGLTHLSLQGWNGVKSFPGEGCLPASLQSLRLSLFRNLETLDFKGLHHLTSLREVKIERCPKLKNITQGKMPASLSELYIHGACPLTEYDIGYQRYYILRFL